MADFPDPVQRPNGKLYQPLKVTGHAVVDEYSDVIAVLVLGTHDVEQARPLAEHCVRMWVDSGYTAVDPRTGWWRDGFQHGERWWHEDEVGGRAGVRFEVSEVR